MARIAELAMIVAVMAVLVPGGLAQKSPELEIRVVYDNVAARPELGADWGFAAVVTFRGRRVLFDSGAKPELFLSNLKSAGVEPSTIEAAVISHEHGDHRNGIYRLYPLTKSIPVFFLKSFPPAAWQEAAAVGMEPRAVGEAQEIVPGIYTTGLVAGSPDEQALVVETSRGLVMLVGCSHPGIVNLVDAALKERGRDSVHLIVGGFHLLKQSQDQILAQIRLLQLRKVRQVRPAHCTGDLAQQLFRKAWGKNFGAAGAGAILTVP